MRASKITSEHLFYWLAFLLALFLRFYQLGAGPLNDTEAGLALSALNLAHGGSAIQGAQPAYILLTSQLFNLLGATNFLARLFPALAGSLIVWLPFLLRRWMGDSGWLRRAGVVMALGLAIDPGLVSLSRQVGSPMPAIAFTLLALACLYNRHMLGLGIFAGLAVLSGPAFLQGLLILVVSWAVFGFAGRKISQPPSDEGTDMLPMAPLSSRALSIALAAFLGTLLVAGTLFLRALQGLGALADTIPAYLDTWVSSSGIPALRLPASLLVYQPLVLIFCLAAVVQFFIGMRDKPLVRLGVAGMSIWALIAILLPLLYAGRQVGDLGWALIPLWALAATEISRYLSPEEDRITRLVAAALGLSLFVLTAFGWINILSIERLALKVSIYSITLTGVLLICVILVLLVAATWSTQAARTGLVWALCLVFGIQLFSNTWGMAILRQNGVQELWGRTPAISQSVELDSTLADLSSWNTGLRDQLEIVSLVDSPALEWVLRNFPNSRFETALASTEAPPVVITLKEPGLPSLAAKYRGQDFVWRLYPGWKGVFPANFTDWFAFRQATMAQDQVILWARVDIFPGGASGTSGSGAP